MFIAMVSEPVTKDQSVSSGKHTNHQHESIPRFSVAPNITLYLIALFPGTGLTF